MIPPVHQPIHKGRILVAAVLLSQEPGELFRRQVLLDWHPGVRIYQLRGRWLMVYETAVWRYAHEVHGLPLVLHQPEFMPDKPFYTSAPLSAEEIRTSRVEKHGVVLVDNNAVMLLSPNLQKEEEFDISQWLQGDLALTGTRALGAAPKGEIATVATGKKTAPVLGKGSAEQRSILKNLTEKGASGGGLLPSFLAKWAMQQGLKENKGSPLKDWFSKTLMSSALGSVFARQQAKYFDKMLSLFEKGDLLNALKHAIPLGSLRDAFDKGRPAVGVPRARQNLGFDFSHGLFGGSGFHLQDRLLEFIKSLYRRSFEKLDQAGNIKEAAFVLSELLREDEEAVAYLEKHKEYTLAAELAEGRCLNPSLIIRQWLLAGNRERALLITRITGAFPSAISYLKDNSPHLVLQLQTEWAQHLEKQGQYLAAAELYLEAAQVFDAALAQRALQCLQQIPQDDPHYAKALLLRALHDEEQFTQLKGEIEELLQDHREDTMLQRYALAEALLQQPASAQRELFSRMAMRSALRDFSAGWHMWDKRRFLKMVEQAGDHALKADIMGLDFQSRLQPIFRYRDEVLQLDLPAYGVNPVEAICPVNDRRYLAALGAAGVILMDERGRTLIRFSQPVHTLIPSIHGNTVLLLYHMGEISSVSLLNIQQRKIRKIGDIRLDCYADSFDGDSWLVAQSNCVLALDLWQEFSSSQQPRAIWSVGDLPGKVTSLSYYAEGFAFLLNDGKEVQSWAYRLPSYSLNQREPLNRSELNFSGLLQQDARGDVVLVQYDADRQLHLSINHQGSMGSRSSLEGVEDIFDVQLAHQWISVIHGHSSNRCLTLLPRTNLQIDPVKIQLRAKGATEIHSQLFHQRMLVWTQGGGVWMFDLENGRVITHFVVK